MTEITKADADRVLLSSFAAIARREACDPIGSRNLSLYVNGDHAPMTRDRVSQTLGHEAAVLWEAMAKSVAAFNVAVERRLNEKQYDGTIKIGALYYHRCETVRVKSIYWCDRQNVWTIRTMTVCGNRFTSSYTSEPHFLETARFLAEGDE